MQTTLNIPINERRQIQFDFLTNHTPIETIKKQFELKYGRMDTHATDPDARVRYNTWTEIEKELIDMLPKVHAQALKSPFQAMKRIHVQKPADDISDVAKSNFERIMKRIEYLFAQKNRHHIYKGASGTTNDTLYGTYRLEKVAVIDIDNVPLTKLPEPKYKHLMGIDRTKTPHVNRQPIAWIPETLFVYTRTHSQTDCPQSIYLYKTSSDKYFVYVEDVPTGDISKFTLRTDIKDGSPDYMKYIKTISDKIVSTL